MVEYIPIPKLEIKVKDVFSMGDLIRIMEEWLKENGFLTLDDKELDQNNQETLYSHKVTDGGSRFDIRIWWRVLKYPQDSSPKTSHVRYRMNVDMHFLGDSGEAEVLQKGKKVKLNKGEMKIEIAPFVEIDPRNEWEKQGLLKLVKDVFRKRVYKKEIDDHIEYFYGQAYKFHAMLKQFFGIEGYMPEETVSAPPKGLM